MEFKKGLFDGENIPDFALQPARPAASFDPTVYDRLFENLKKSPETEETNKAVESAAQQKFKPVEKKAAVETTVKPAEQPIEKAAAVESEAQQTVKPTVKPVEKKAAVETTVKPAEQPTEKAAAVESAAQQPVKPVEKRAAVETTEQPVEQATEKVAAVETTVQPAKQPVEKKAAVETTVKPAEQPTEKAAAVETTVQPAEQPTEKAAAFESEAQQKFKPVEKKAAVETTVQPAEQPTEKAAAVETTKVLEPTEKKAVIEAEIAEGEVGIVTADKVVKPTAQATKPIMADEVTVKSQLETSEEDQKFRQIKYTDFGRSESFIIKVQEDILITDAKPDMSKMLNIIGNCRLAERNVSIGSSGTYPVRVMGDLAIQALYAAEDGINGPEIIPVDSRIPFREDFTIKTDEGADIVLKGEIVSISSEKINERKFKVNAEIEVIAREYCPKEMNIFEGINNEVLQTLAGEMEYTDISIRKTEQFEISEEASIPEGAAEIDQILCYDVNIIEGHKQIGSEKAMISGVVNINLLYASVDGPVFYNCKTDFTHFMKIDEENVGYPLIGGRTDFNIVNCSLTPKRNVDGYFNTLCLDMEVELDLEYYKQLQEPYILDAYHYSKDISCSKEKNVLSCLQGGGAMDIPIREIADVSDYYGKLDKVICITGSPKITKDKAVQGKIDVEGVLPVTIICTSAESGKLPFSIDKDLGFKAEIDVSGCREGMLTDCQVALKDLGFDQINNRQVSINGEIHVSGYVSKKNSIELINSVAIAERKQDIGPSPSIIVYAAKNDDTVWRVSKKYHIPISRLRAINDLSEHEELKPGAKILIVK